LRITHISETILSILTKLCPNVPWVILFQSYFLVSYLFIKQNQMILNCNLAVAKMSGVEIGMESQEQYSRRKSLKLNNIQAGMSLEAGNRQKSSVTLAVTAGYIFSLTKIRNCLLFIDSFNQGFHMTNFFSHIDVIKRSPLYN
jgi:hypothetical protein